MKNWIFAALLSVVVVASSTDSLAQVSSSVGLVQQAFVSSRWDGVYAFGDPTCQTTPDGFTVSLLGIIPPGGVNNLGHNFFVPRTHRDYEVIVAMIISAKISGSSIYILPEPYTTLVCGMPVVASLGLVN